VIILSVVALFSPFILYKSQNHLFLMNVWILPVFITACLHLTQKNTQIRYFFLSGLVFGTTTLFSNYLGFFGLLFSAIYLSLFALYDLYQNRFQKQQFLYFLSRYSVLYFSVLVPILLLNFRYIEATYLNPTLNNNAFTLERSVDDFFIFSSRPWYYFLPSVDNPVYGSFSRSVLNFLENDWGSYLAQNYFKSEHSSSYLGIVNFILAILGVRYLFQNRTHIKDFSQIVLLGVSALILITFTMPPYLEISGYRIYFPSYFIADYFSMFRVLARMGILILLLQLIFTGFGYLQIHKFFQKYKAPNFYFFITSVFLFFVSVSEFYIPLKFTDISQMPDVYHYLKQNSNNEDKLVIFPRGKSLEGYFWSKDHGREVIIPERDHFINGKLVKKDDFYNQVAFTCEGLQLLKEYGASYLIYFYNSDTDSQSKISFLNKNLENLGHFTKIEKPDSYENIFYKVSNTGNTLSNQAYLFRINDVTGCNTF